jgi:hypothetical protein
MGTNERQREHGPTSAETPELAMQGLALARAASGLAHQVRNPLNAMALQAALLTEGLALFEHEARRRQVTLEAEAVVPGLLAHGDAVRVGRMWMGLLWRALEETAAGGWVRLHCRRDGDELALAVEWLAAARQPGTDWIPKAVAEGALAVGGQLEEWQGKGTAGAALRLRVEGR